MGTHCPYCSAPRMKTRTRSCKWCKDGRRLHARACHSLQLQARTVCSDYDHALSASACCFCRQNHLCSKRPPTGSKRSLTNHASATRIMQQTVHGAKTSLPHTATKGVARTHIHTRVFQHAHAHTGTHGVPLKSQTCLQQAVLPSPPQTYNTEICCWHACSGSAQGCPIPKPAQQHINHAGHAQAPANTTSTCLCTMQGSEGAAHNAGTTRQQAQQHARNCGQRHNPTLPRQGHVEAALYI